LILSGFFECVVKKQELFQNLVSKKPN